MANGTVEALFPYSYESGDGRTIAFAMGDRFTLLNKTNGDWWQVRKGSEKPMYVPASYMKEIVQRRNDPIYENIEDFEKGSPHNGEAVINAENGPESKEEEHNSIEENTIPNSDSRFDHQNNEGPVNSEENSADSSVISSNSDVCRRVSSSVKSLAKSLELVSVLVCVQRFNCLCSSFALFITVFGKSTVLIAKEYERKIRPVIAWQDQR